MAKIKRRRKKVAKRRVTRRAKQVRRAPRDSSTFVTDAVAQLTLVRDNLLEQRATLDDQITKVDKALAAMDAPWSAGGARRSAAARPARSRRPVRGRRSGSLKEYIAKVLTAPRGAMAVKDITAAILKSGYNSKNRTLAKSVGIALTQMKDMTKVARGVFRKK